VCVFVCVCMCVLNVVSSRRRCNIGRSCFTAGLHSCRTSHKFNTKFPFKQCILWWLGDWQPHPLYCMTVPLVDMNCRVSVCVCVCVCVCVSYVVISSSRRSCNIGRSCFTAGLHSWKTSQKFNTKFPFKQCILWELGDLQSHPIYCMTVPVVDMKYIVCVCVCVCVCV